MNAAARNGFLRKASPSGRMSLSMGRSRPWRRFDVPRSKPSADQSSISIQYGNRIRRGSGAPKSEQMTKSAGKNVGLTFSSRCISTQGRRNPISRSRTPPCSNRFLTCCLARASNGPTMSRSQWTESTGWMGREDSRVSILWRNPSR